jgi:L-ascorbate metabolism protein UlaG (beta-lactamase superfamily)
VVEIGGRRVYFAGDSGPGTPFAEIGERCGPLDVALMPVGGSTLAVGPLQRHLTPLLAARATAALRPRVVIPMHWGHVPCVPAVIDRFRGTPSPFVEAMREVAPEVRALWPDDGEQTPIQV